MYCSMEHILSRYSKGIDLECQTNRNEEHGVPEVSITANSYVFYTEIKMWCTYTYFIFALN